ncbi:MAG: outer membrane beta-barrel protein [Proteobacteria bacterium]|nr:outer membrane beta-barrel protein [Pseudomonadota bacterium]
MRPALIAVLIAVLIAGGGAQEARAQSAALHPVSGPASSVDVVLGDASGRFAAPGYFRQAPPPLDFAYYAGREGRPDDSGITVDDFRVAPRLTVDETFNSNVFAKSSHPKSDAVTVINPSVAVSSLWGAHAATFSAALREGLFARFSGEDYTDGQVGSEGRYDIDRDSALGGGAAFQHSHVPRGSPDDARGNAPTPVDIAQTRVDYLRRLGDAEAEIELRYEDFAYSNVAAATGPIDNSILDRAAFAPRLRLAYGVVPEALRVFAQVRYRSTAYRRLVLGLDRDSQNYQEVLGAQVTPGGPLSGEIFVGVMQQHYASPQLASFTTPAFGASLAWTPTLLTTVRAEAGRSVEDATLNGFSGYRQTAVTMALDHELLRSVLLHASVFRADRDYIGQTRHETFTQAGFGVRYAIGDALAAGFSLTYSQREANFSDASFDQILALFRLSARL